MSVLPKPRRLLKKMTARFSKLISGAIAIVVLSLCAATPASAQKKARTEPLPRLLSVREQINVREGWLKTRLDKMLLPMMRRHKVGMWIVTNEEFHPETVVPYIAPPIPYEGRRDFFIFTDRGGNKLERIALVRYPEEHLSLFFEVLNPPGRDIQSTLKKVVEERNPTTIALNFGGTRGATNGLTYEAHKFLTETLGKEFTERFVSAAPLIV